jgi:hypothetical protein
MLGISQAGGAEMIRPNRSAAFFPTAVFRAEAAVRQEIVLNSSF